MFNTIDDVCVTMVISLCRFPMAQVCWYTINTTYEWCRYSRDTATAWATWFFTKYKKVTSNRSKREDHFKLHNVLNVEIREDSNGEDKKVCDKLRSVWIW